VTRLLLTVIATLFLGVGVARAGTFEDGLAAYQHGDYGEALKWYRLAADQGNAAAQFALGGMYENGLGLPQDYAKAVKWFRLAAAQGYANAQYELGILYDDGLGVQQDYAQAADWFRLAAAQGDAGAQTNLGLMYDSGHGVPQDYVRAHMWFNLAGTAGGVPPGVVPPGVMYRDMVSKLMTPQQIAEAQQMAQKCQQRKFKDCE
jgi:TPR repeat protein